MNIGQAKDAQLFAEWTSEYHWCFVPENQQWYRMVDEDERRLYTTAELYNSEEFKRYKEAQNV